MGAPRYMCKSLGGRSPIGHGRTEVHVQIPWGTLSDWPWACRGTCANPLGDALGLAMGVPRYMCKSLGGRSPIGHGRAEVHVQIPWRTLSDWPWARRGTCADPLGDALRLAMGAPRYMCRSLGGRSPIGHGRTEVHVQIPWGTLSDWPWAHRGTCANPLEDALRLAMGAPRYMCKSLG